MKLDQSKLLIGAALLIVLSACDNKSSSSLTPAPTPAPVAAATPQSQISTQFAADFNASPNSLPVPKPAQSDLPAVSLTATPIALH